MDNDKKKKLIQEKIKQVKEKKKLGHKEGKNVSKPKRSQKRADASKLKGKDKKTVAVGPKGGIYTVSSAGKREYSEKSMKKSFIENFKREIEMKEDNIKKAVDSMSADVENKPVDDATLNGENAPSIQEASTPSQQEAAPAEPAAEPVKEDVQPEPEVKAEEPKVEEPAPEQNPEISFDGLFADDYQVGSTLQQDPKMGGNVMTNMKKPGMDYVERAKNHKNVSFTSDQMKDQKGK